LNFYHYRLWNPLLPSQKLKDLLEKCGPWIKTTLSPGENWKKQKIPIISVSI